MKLEPATIAGIIGVAAGLFLFFTPPGKEILQKIQNYFNPPPLPVFQRPPATNAYVPDPSIDEWSYQNAIRKDYEAMTRLETHPYNEQTRQWNVGNINPNFENYLQKKYF